MDTLWQLASKPSALQHHGLVSRWGAENVYCCYRKLARSGQQSTRARWSGGWGFSSRCVSDYQTTVSCHSLMGCMAVHMNLHLHRVHCGCIGTHAFQRVILANIPGYTLWVHTPLWRFIGGSVNIPSCTSFMHTHILLWAHHRYYMKLCIFLSVLLTLFSLALHAHFMGEQCTVNVWMTFRITIKNCR